jgi:hypothetical protein
MERVPVAICLVVFVVLLKVAISNFGGRARQAERFTEA